jgi:hypothetical protein
MFLRANQVAVAVLFFVSVAPLRAGDVTLRGPHPAVRLQVQVEPAEPRVGQPVTLVVRPLDVNDVPVPAPAGADLPFSIVLTPPDPQATGEPLAAPEGGFSVRAGELQARVAWTPPHDGAWKAKARCPDLADGTVLVSVGPSELLARREPRPVPLSVVPVRPDGPEVALAERPARVAADRPATLALRDASTPLPTPPPVVTPLPLGHTAAPDAEPAAATSAPRVTASVYFSLDAERVAAGRKGTVRLQTLLTGAGPEGLADDLVLTVAAPQCDLEPRQVRIPRGTTSGNDVLIRRAEVGEVSVEMIDASPYPATPRGLPSVVRFIPPISRLGIDVAPEVVPGEPSTLTVELQDESGTPVASDRDRVVTLTPGGPIELASTRLTIAADRASEQVGFKATRTGTLSVKAAIADFSPSTVEIRAVEAPEPVLPYVIGALSGLLGGGLAVLLQRRKPGAARGARDVATRLLLGVVAGFLLYWAAQVGLVSAGQGASMALKVSAVALGILGGMGGTRVPDLLSGKIMGPR